MAEVPVTWVEMPGSKLNLLTGAVTMLRDMALVQAAARVARAIFACFFFPGIFMDVIFCQILSDSDIMSHMLAVIPKNCCER